MKLFKKREMIHFSGRRHTKLGVLSAGIGILVVIGFLSISFASGTLKGNGGLLFGVIGFVLLGLSVFGFYLSYNAFKERDIFYRFPVIGIVLNGFMTILLIVLYILGFGG